jgi:hypothetical protein
MLVWEYGRGGFMKLLIFIENNGEPAPTKLCIIITIMLPDMILLSS